MHTVHVVDAYRAAREHPGAMERAALEYWTGVQEPCPRCGSTGVPIVLEITDADTRDAVREGLACLGECCFDGARGVERECVKCGHQWARGEQAVG